jgi:hypothetical protein
VAHPGPITRRREHLDALCDEHNVLCKYQPKGSTHARAYPEQRQVLIPRTTMIRSYYLALHEIAHCVLGFDHDRPAAPQEAEAWQWAISQSIEPPTPGLKRMVFKALWHYLLSDLGVRGAEDLSNRDLFPAPDDPFWSFLATLDDGSRLLYEAAKVTARTGPPADWQAKAYQELDEERRRFEQALEQARNAARRAVVREQLRFYGPPSPAKSGERVLVGSGVKAHMWRYDSQYGAVTKISDIFCGVSGVAHPAPAGAPACRACGRLCHPGESPAAF